MAGQPHPHAPLRRPSGRLSHQLLGAHVRSAALADTARTAVTVTYALRNAADHPALDTTRARANSAADELVTAAGELLAAA
ncbi:hypothetical protein IPZ61_02685 [Streptomyces sioyaensis]|uniref:hypothetical protein n=1 Tax=Streptomyces sioyaensis TaxID=67364 RepID=UPI001F2F2FA6|nr:hypothetical protein [Streptomyces sioyaensis]MCF3172239.1 hypothetical protein [Streptomyces sioyaensis]